MSDLVDNASPSAIIAAAREAGIADDIVDAEELQPYSGVWIENCGCYSEHFCTYCNEIYDDRVMKETVFAQDIVCPIGHIGYIYDAVCEHIEAQIVAYEEE